MSCILTIGGLHFDVDDFVDKSKLQSYKKSYKGQPKFKTKPDGEKLTHFSLSIETSKADFDQLDKQITDTIRFLERNKEKLTLIGLTTGIDFAVLDFGVDLTIDKEEVLYQSCKLPNELLRLAGDLGLGIILSIYPTDMQEQLEKQHSKTK